MIVSGRTEISPLMTDLYQLTMISGYLGAGIAHEPAAFDFFFRTNPYAGGYAVFAGLAPLLDALEGFRFSDEELAYLDSLELFPSRFFEYLGNFRFRGRVIAPPEGTVVFANSPIVTVEATLAEAQIVESLLLNLLNFQTLVATKAARLVHAAGDGEILEFGLRRAHGPNGALFASRAAAVGGVRSTSNVEAGMLYDLPVRGTMAHSWIMAFSDELAAFRAYATAFPKNCVLLIDTYDTLKSGLPHALTVAAEMRSRGESLLGVRIDSGDLSYLSRAVREAFDAAGFSEVRVVVTNDLDEHVISAIRQDGGRADLYGVGTRLVIGAGEGGGALGGVYKLVELDDIAKLKVTSDAAKATIPGRKRLLRAIAPDGSYVQDVVTLLHDPFHPGQTVYDPGNPLQHVAVPADCGLVDLRAIVMDEGRRVEADEPIEAMAERCRNELARLPEGCDRLVNPHRYKVSLSPRLNELRNSLIEAIRADEAAGAKGE